MNRFTLERVLRRIKENTRWYNKSYAGYLFSIAQQGLAIAKGEKISPYAIPYGLVFQSHTRPDHWDWFWDSELLVQKREAILAAAQADKHFTSRFYQTWKKEWAAFLVYWETVANVDFNTCTPEEIREKLAGLHENYTKQAGYGYVVDIFLNDTKEDWLEELIKKELGRQATPEVIAILTAPVAESFVNEFEMSKLLLAQRLLSNESKAALLSACTNLAQKFFWIQTTYVSYSRLSAQDVYHEAEEDAKKFEGTISQKIAEEKSRISDNRKKKASLMKKLRVSSALARVIEISETFTAIQDKRKERVLRTNAICFDALAALAQKMNLLKETLFYLIPIELASKETFGNIDWKQIEKRRSEGVLAIFCEDRAYLMSREQYEKELPIHNFFPSLTQVQEIKGSTAYKGLVRGIARIVRTPLDIQNFQEGEILVANQTTPEYVPAMKKAAAFVTDQGGITCHAAIIAREIKKPCVIGTKIATQVLKDGDHVEVDANKGIVRILEKS